MSERDDIGKYVLKGGILKGYFDFIKSEHGADAQAQCIRETGIDPKDIIAKDYYSGEMNEDILRWISGNYGIHELKKAGNFTAKNLGSLTHLVRFANIRFFLRKAKDSYEETFQFGRISVLNDEYGKMATVVFKDCNVIEESCEAWIGAFEGFFEVTRTKGTVKKTKCQLKGDEYCEYKLVWE